MPSASILTKSVREVASYVAERHVRVAPEIREIFLFPSHDEIRLIEIDPTTLPSSEITPYYFNPDPVNGVPYISAVALIRPEEKKRLLPPKEWGTWQDGEKIWPKSRSHKQPR